jgi:hypothetical protein
MNTERTDQASAGVRYDAPRLACFGTIESFTGGVIALGGDYADKAVSDGNCPTQEC